MSTTRIGNIDDGRLQKALTIVFHHCLSISPIPHHRERVGKRSRPSVQFDTRCVRMQYADRGMHAAQTVTNGSNCSLSVEVIHDRWV